MTAGDIVRALQAEEDWQRRLASMLMDSSRLMRTIGESMSNEGNSAPERALGGALLKQVMSNEEACRRLYIHLEGLVLS